MVLILLQHMYDRIITSQVIARKTFKTIPTSGVRYDLQSQRRRPRSTALVAAARRRQPKPRWIADFIAYIYYETDLVFVR